LAQSGHHGLTKLLQEGAGWVGYFKAVPRPLWRQSARTNHIGV